MQVVLHDRSIEDGYKYKIINKIFKITEYFSNPPNYAIIEKSRLNTILDNADNITTKQREHIFKRYDILKKMFDIYASNLDLLFKKFKDDPESLLEFKLYVDLGIIEKIYPPFPLDSKFKMISDKEFLNTITMYDKQLPIFKKVFNIYSKDIKKLNNEQRMLKEFHMLIDAGAIIHSN